MMKDFAGKEAEFVWLSDKLQFVAALRQAEFLWLSDKLQFVAALRQAEAYRTPFGAT
jgi:hypothetical protein